MPKQPQKNESNEGFEVPAMHAAQTEDAPVIAQTFPVHLPDNEPKPKLAFPALPTDWKIINALWKRISALPERTQQQCNEKALLQAQVGPHWRRLQQGAEPPATVNHFPHRPGGTIVAELAEVVRQNIRKS